MKDFKLDLTKLDDDELPSPIWFEKGADGLSLKIHEHPRAVEILAEAKRRGLTYEKGKFYRKENRGLNRGHEEKDKNFI